jgi:diguanylate cyclase (GGDEF)-like protein
MDSIIKHMVEITGHRDHDLLNISIISALRELTNAESARVLDLVTLGGQTFLKTQIALAQGKVVVIDENSASVPGNELVSSHPNLEAGIAQATEVIESISADGKRTVWFPIKTGEKINVCLEIVNPATYNENTKEVMAGILIVYRNFQNLLDYSERDSLTGLLNRKTFDDNFSKLLRASATQADPSDTERADPDRRSNAALNQDWLGVLDIDHFKRVNDTFGHLYGDEVLILIANLMRSSFRPSDKLFRFGGEEFVILLRSTSQADAQLIFDRFRENVAQYDFPQVGTVTVSIGFAHIDPFEPAVGIVGKADQALYFAKSHGRNLACHYESLVANGDLIVEQSNDDVEFF